MAALMAVGGCFLPLFRLQPNPHAPRIFFGDRLTVTETAWATHTEVPGQVIDQAAAPVGIPVVLAVVVLAAAAFAGFSRPGRGLARWLVSAGAFFTAGVVVTIGMSGVGWGALSGGIDLEVVTATGMWLLIGAAVLAAAAAVLAHLPAWWHAGDNWSDPALAYADTPTPPDGVAITVLPPDDE
ncbi:hypothetical protein [Amycolatopsis australiensis]|uniref:hypothetical protein n=1 Tax=Amycolatopsis australiensis TaxID=546364 RepID=UPI001FE45C8A|nr:hypothetical protein [Amycolatopsis australiensis]